MARLAPRPNRSNPLRAGITGAVMVALVIVGVGALIFSNSYATRRVVGDAVAYRQAQATLGSNDVAVKALAQAVLLAEDRDLGVADDETAALAAREARSALDALEESGRELLLVVEDRRPELESSLDAALDAGRGVVELLDLGRVSEAGVELKGPAKASFEWMRDEATTELEGTGSSIASTDQLVGRLGNIAAFLVAFLIPTAAILSYRRVARRQLHMAELQLDARLDAEREVTKAKDEFIANISHELRTPLTTIYGFSEVLLEAGIVDPDSSLELIGLINAESAELNRMVEDLLTSARVDAGQIVYQYGPVDVAAEIETVMAPMSRGGISASVDCSHEPVWGDQLRVRQIVRNLISNADHHGGPNIRVVGRAGDGFYTATVADDGPGVAPTMVPRLFTRFVHEGRDPLMVGSVGLGLAVARSLARAMGGDLRYERSEGWTRFTFTLPLATADDGSGWRPDTVAMHPVESGMRVAASQPLREGWPGEGAA